MGHLNPIQHTFQLPDGREVQLETGRLARQADGSALLRMGNTMILCTVVSAKKAKEDMPFFPLFVDYQEKFAAAGRIPGNFFRREARLNEYEILTSRLVDRAIRPLFPDHYMNETQVMISLISADEDVQPDALVALTVSTALSISDIPWNGPISEVRVARINGEFKVNPGKSEMENADLDIIVGATMENVMMVEGEMDECSEQELIEAIKVGHEAIKTQCQAQLDLVAKLDNKAPTREVPEPEENEEVLQFVKDHAAERISEIVHGRLDKDSRKTQFSETLDALKEKYEEENGEEALEENAKFIENYFSDLRKKTIRTMVIKDRVRLDGRRTDEVRPITCEVDFLPSVHGSALFTRGETQSLTSLTLGSKLDEQMIDTAMENSNRKFILHYNFPAFSVGEIKPNRGPGRREIGHANLASRSLERVFPEEQPYTIRIVSDILESNGSSSMATVCAGSLALMDAGINIKSPVSGIAMGMIKEGDDIAILTDILGDEDAIGDMDFKVTGTAQGITACQMDIKIDGLPYEQMEEALIQAREGRIHILDKMSEALAGPREDLKPFAPRIEEVIIEKSKIGAVIGSGGKVIQELQEETNTTISIEEVDDKGIVQIASSNKDDIDEAIRRIKIITFEPTVGATYEAEVTEVLPFGVVVEFKGQNGLLHISEFSYSHVDKVEDVFSMGDQVKVKLLSIDERSGKLKLSRKATMEKPEGYVEERNDRRGGRDNRGGRNRGRDNRGRNNDRRNRN
ncbi:polyribonucleotide nucleotidyltransferase [Membranicola marinus]|uniref:Polyribonucleotide nucleotidyltransferase n=1 Tax=Membranihabitans marinus TaxID=1227546 RepID=A0A953HSX9_9BACT|nr:polyribonucleotide nucleotidyltransferase [Membranihabitans marinus]MBY5957760.1 polyribonucleotide nucleotidyltransferase [Membranihabitans marinus]